MKIKNKIFQLTFFIIFILFFIAGFYRSVLAEEKNSKENKANLKPHILIRRLDWNEFVFSVDNFDDIDINQGVKWIFGDEQTSTNLFTKHKYQDYGNYLVNFKYINKYGDEVELEALVVVPFFYIKNIKLWIILIILLILAFIGVGIGVWLDKRRNISTPKEEDNEMEDEELLEEYQVLPDDIDWDKVEEIHYKDDDMKELEKLDIKYSKVKEDKESIEEEKKQVPKITKTLKKVVSKKQISSKTTKKNTKESRKKRKSKDDKKTTPKKTSKKM